jgi:hypothetical protein
MKQPDCSRVVILSGVKGISYDPGANGSLHSTGRSRSW